MMVKLSRLLVVTVGVFFAPGVGDNALASSNVEVCVDLDGDGFDDQTTDCNMDGIPDLVVPIEQPKVPTSPADLLRGAATAAPSEPVKKTKAQRFALRIFSVRALATNRASPNTGFGEIGSAAALGAEACPGGNCGL